MMEQITLEQFRRTVRIRLRLLRVFILLCAAAVSCAHFWGHRGGVPGARFPYYAFRAGHLRRFYLHPPYKNAS